MKNDLSATLGRNIKKRREELGLTQRDLATKINAKELAVSNWERGVQGIRPKNLVALSEALEVPTRYFYQDDHLSVVASDESETPAHQDQPALPGTGLVLPPGDTSNLILAELLKKTAELAIVKEENLKLKARIAELEKKD